MLLTEQIEKSRIMIDVDSQLPTYLMTLMIQYGYISMFMTLYPLSSLIGFIGNNINIWLTTRTYAYITKRSISQQVSGLGVWNELFVIISFMSTIVNAALLVFTSNETHKLYSDNENDFRDFFIAVAAEHAIILLKFLLDKMIDDFPLWVKIFLILGSKRNKSRSEFKSC